MKPGAPFEEMVREHVPDVGGITYFSSMADMILALKSGKTDEKWWRNGSRCDKVISVTSALFL